MTTPANKPSKLTIPELDYLRQLAAKLAEAKHGTKNAIAADAMAMLGCSKAEVYRKLAQAGFASGRKPRSDKGTTAVTNEAAQLVGGMIMQATRANGKQTLSIKLATEILAAQGLIADVSAVTVAKALKANLCHPTQSAVAAAHTQQASLYPNYVWQIDASICVLFYLRNGKGMQVMEEKEFYKNKPHNLDRIRKERVIRYVIVDHYSGSIYVEYVLGSEDTTNLVHCFINAIQKRDSKHPMHGVPAIVYMDKGSANTSNFFTNLLEALDVKPLAHAAGNPRATGAVEKAQDIVECNFESRLTFIAVNSIEQLNQLASQWLASFNASAKHTRHKRNRNDVWLTITNTQLRIAPPRQLCLDLINSKPVNYLVRGDLTVTHTPKGYPNQTYSVRHIEGIYPKAEVKIRVNAYRIPDVDVLFTNMQGITLAYTVSPVTINAGGFMTDHSNVIGEEVKQQIATPTEQMAKQLNRQAYGVETNTEVDKARKNRTAAYSGQLNPLADVQAVQVADTIAKAGTELVTPNAPSRQLQPLTVVEAAGRIRSIVGDLWTRDHMQALRTTYPTGQVPQEAIEAIADAINSNGVAEIITLDAKPMLRIVNN